MLSLSTFLGHVSGLEVLLSSFQWQKKRRVMSQSWFLLNAPESKYLAAGQVHFIFCRGFDKSVWN